VSRRWRLAARTLSLASMVCAVFFACAGSPANTATQPDPQAIARNTVLLLKDAWIATEQTCVATAKAQKNDAIRANCQKVLDPALMSLGVAANSVDAWGAADQKNVPCLVNSVANALLGIETLVPQVALPAMVNSAVAVARSFAGSACEGLIVSQRPTDGGAE
jgi:hypothetical protein